MTETAQKNKKKRTVITIVIIAASIVLIAGVVLAVVLLNNIPSSGTVRRSVFAAGDELSKKKYAADSGLERGDSKRTGNYWIKRCEDEKIDYLRVKSENYNSSDKQDYVEFKVFNSSKDAKKYFKKTYSYYIEFDAEFDNEGANWFIVKEPQTYDAAWKTIYYLEDNVILSAEVWYVYYGTWGEGEDQTQATLAFERSELTKYVMDNAADLRKQVLTFLSDVL